MDKIFDIWPSIKDMAEELGKPYQTVAAWKQRGIPAACDPEVIAAAARRGATLTFDELHKARRDLRDQKQGTAA